MLTVLVLIDSVYSVSVSVVWRTFVFDGDITAEIRQSFDNQNQRVRECAAWSGKLQTKLVIVGLHSRLHLRNV